MPTSGDTLSLSALRAGGRSAQDANAELPLDADRTVPVRPNPGSSQSRRKNPLPPSNPPTALSSVRPTLLLLPILPWVTLAHPPPAHPVETQEQEAGMAWLNDERLRAIYDGRVAEGVASEDCFIIRRKLELLRHMRHFKSHWVAGRPFVMPDGRRAVQVTRSWAISFDYIEDLRPFGLRLESPEEWAASSHSPSPPGAC
jgi:hypothetical protein